MRSDVFAAVSVSFIIKSGGALLSFVMFAAIGRVLGIKEYGDFAFGFATAQFLSVILCMGMPTQILRDVPITLARDGAERAFSLIANAAAIVIFVIGLCLIAMIAVGLFQSRILFWLATGVLAALLAWSELASATLRSLGAVASALAPREILWRSSVLVSVGLATAFSIPMNATHWLATTAVLLVLICIVQYLASSRSRLPSASQRSYRLEKLWEKAFAARGLWLVTVLSTFDQQVPILMVRSIANAEVTALLFAAMKTAAVIGLPIWAAGQVIAPQISKAYAERDLQALQSICVHSAILTSLGAGAALGFIILFGSQLLDIFGPNFMAARQAILILAVAQLISAALGPTGYVLLMTGNQRSSLVALALGATTSVMTILVLTPLIGLSGAAIGAGTMTVVNKGISYIIAHRKMGVHLSLLGLFFPAKGTGL